MLSVYGILLSALLGSCLTLLFQILFFYRRKPEAPEGSSSPLSSGAYTTRVVPDSCLKEYFAGFVGVGQEATSSATLPSNQSPSKTEQSPKQAVPSQDSSSSSSSSVVEATEETLYWLNAICIFLFRELKDTTLVRHWVTRKVKVEFEELLQTKVTGKVLEGLSLRDVSFGNVVPVFKNIKILRPVTCSEEGCPEELDFEVDIEYNGGFHLAIDADLVFGKSAYLFAKISRVVGRIRLVFTRLPFTHWSFAFVDEPVIGLEVKSQFEGRPLPQLTSIIVNQFKKVIRRKHTLPHYKIRFKPFFPFQVVPPEEYRDRSLSIQDFSLTEGRLKVSLIECSRLFIFGSYEREVTIHCTFELSDSVWEEKERSFIKTAELIKGNSPGVGLTLRQVQAKEGETGHVVIETVIPNSAAAAADLQRGDRLIAIGGVKITSTIHVLKLIRQAGDRVIVHYERPVGYNQQNSLPQDNLAQFVNSAFPDEDASTEIDNKELDLQFEDLANELKSCESRDDSSTSPKHTSVSLTAKPPGTVSPILNRKLHFGSHQSSGRALFREAAKQVVLKNSENLDATQQTDKHSQTSTTKPPVPPRPQLKVAPVPNEVQNILETGDLSSEKSEKLPIPASNGDKNSEKLTKNTDVEEDPTGSKSVTCKPEMAKEPLESSLNSKTVINKPVTNKLEVIKEPSESSQSSKTVTNKPVTNKLEAIKEPSESSQSSRSTIENHNSWESPEIPYRKRLGKWARTKACSYLFEVEKEHKYLNVAIWCRDPFKLGGLLCLGYESIKLEEIALDCIATSSMEFIRQFRLNPSAPKAAVSRTALRALISHKGFSENFCYGDITIHFKYLRESEPEDSSFLLEKEKEYISEEAAAPILPKDDPYFGQIIYTENKHNFQDTQFQNPTWCDYCKKKVWTKAASQCVVCAYVCHKKCQEKCLTESPFCLGAARRLERDLRTFKFDSHDSQSTPASRADAELKTANKTTGLTRHIINTSTRLLNLRQVPKVRVSEQGADAVEPSPKHTPHASDNEGSDTETGGPSSPSKQASGTGIKLPRKEGGLDDSVFIAVKEIGRDLYRSLPTEERIQKLEVMLEKLQYEIDQELENNNSLIREKKETTDTRKKMLLSAALAKSGERLQALTLLTIHYRAGIEDIEALENATLDLESRKQDKYEDENITEEMENEVENALVMEPVLEQLLKEGLERSDNLVD
ncbi:PDZ domain-containing protein 8 [Rhineura floridana]|uniref:PDZ domain-containing protein 8 n=1 Tax=Rhineura floridana TaxID=261503 RepID=UPI002AC8895E|nr:PDZ domain-containing protein 8 [Rhineura floridana]